MGEAPDRPGPQGPEGNRRPLYDSIGVGYASTRRPDPRIAAQIHAGLGNARRILNVGAGAGSYEPTDRAVIAVEPSPVMLAQRASEASPAVRAVAEALPFPDQSFDAAMAVLTLHHWTDQPGGIAELRRVARRIVVFTFDTDAFPWVATDYLPEMIGQVDFDFPTIGELATVLDAVVEAVPIPRDCTDGFTGAYWARPEGYLDPAARAGMSAVRKLDPAVVEVGIERLRADLASGAWDERHGHLRELEELDLGYRLLVTRECRVRERSPRCNARDPAREATFALPSKPRIVLAECTQQVSRGVCRCGRGGNTEMQAAEARRAVAAAMSTASALDLTVDDAVVLSDSNRLVVRLTPCDVVARVVPPASLAPAAARASWLSGEAYQARLATEVEVVKRLRETDSPVAGVEPRVDPRVFVRDSFAITMWTYFEPVPRMLPPADYAQALERLHAGLRQIDVTTPHFMERIGATQQDVASREVTPDLSKTDRALLANTLRDLREAIVNRRAAEQILHGEPHPWNVLNTENAPLFMDFEDSVHGPVEFDLAWVPKEVSERYPDADQDLVGECRGLVLAIIATHRWSRDDQHPSGRPSGVAFLNALREGPPWPPLNTV